jgi:hypothetical protein
MPDPFRTSTSSRERNRIHARKTRQRKKEQMQLLQQRADELKQEQMRLKQLINEKNTASILIGLLAKKQAAGESAEDPRVEALLRRPVQEIPDMSKLPELPALILPGQHASRKARAEAKSCSSDVPNDGIDYDLLGKDRSKCTPEELDQIRRERNRMHAKRTRDRKRKFLDEMGEMCRQLEEENDLLRDHLKHIDPDLDESVLPRRTQVISPEGPTPLLPRFEPSHLYAGAPQMSYNPSVAPTKVIQANQLKTLLDVAGSFGKETSPVSKVLLSVAAAAAVSGASDSESSGLDCENFSRPSKRVRAV